MKLSTILFLLFASTFVQLLTAQNNKDLIQLSGVVVSTDSLQPIPFTNIFVKHTRHGTISDYYGYFSFVAQKGDTLVFSELGFARAEFIIPDSLSTNRYSLIQLMKHDTIWLQESVVFPWPTKEQFKQVFLNLNAPDDDLERARKNLSYDNMKDLYNTLPVDASISYKYAMQQQYSKLYQTGQYPSYNILNPIAWSQFIQAWKRGDFKKKD